MKRLLLALLPWLVTALISAGAVRCYNEGQREMGAMAERLRVADSTAAALSSRARVIDTVYRTDTVRLTASVASWRAAVARLEDSVAVLALRSPDTVRVPVEVVREVVVAADSAIQACTAVVQTCEQRVAVRDSLLAVERQRSAILARQRPSAFRVWGERALWGLLVFTVAQR